MLTITFPQWDRDLFLLLNSKHLSRLDPIMYFLSTYAFWIATLAIILVYMIYSDKLMGRRAAFFMFVSVGLNFVINRIVKFFVMRPRPGSDPIIQKVMRQLEDMGDSSSFFSAHASCSFSLALFASLYFRNKYFSFFIFLWALIVSYSRIYVGKHYPLDVLVGIMFGLLTGWMGYWMYRTYCRRKDLSAED